MKIDRFRRVPSGWALLAAFACNSPQRDLGQLADGGADMPVEMGSSASECPIPPRQEKLQAPRQATFLSEFAGTWIGHAEDALGAVNRDGALPTYAFPSGSTRILLEVSSPDQVVAQLTFGEGDPPLPPSDPNLGSPLDPDYVCSGYGAALSALPPADGFVYSAEPVASALDLERSGADEAAGEQLALDGKLVLAFSTSCAMGRCSAPFRSELHLRFAGDGLIGAFDGLNLINGRGFLTRPGSVRFRRAENALGAPGTRD
jgi:hypothetical protein